MEHGGDDDANYDCYTWNNPQKVGTENRGNGKRKKNRGHTEYNTVNIEKNTVVHNIKVCSLLQFLSNCLEKEREYESWVVRVSWTKKKNMSWTERADPDLEFSFSILLLLYRLYSLVLSSQVRIEFVRPPSMESVNFHLSLYFRGYCSNSMSLPLHVFNQLLIKKWHFNRILLSLSMLHANYW